MDQLKYLIEFEVYSKFHDVSDLKSKIQNIKYNFFFNNCGFIPAQDYQFLYDAGVVAIFGLGTSVAIAGKKILEVLLAVHE